MLRSSLIEVELRDGTLCWLAPRALDLFLRRGRVARFRRAEGWAVVGRDPLRSGADPSYRGPERRSVGPFCQLPLVV